MPATALPESILTPQDAPAIILLVDDEHSVLLALKRALSRHGFSVLTAESAEAAMQLLSQLERDPSPTSRMPQVVLSDHRLQHMDGVTFLAQVKARWPTIQRVLITGFADLDAIERAVNEAGIYRFVNKPWEDLSLLGTVRSAVEQWQAVTENQRLLLALEGHNRRLEEAVAARTEELSETTRQLAVTDRMAAIGQLAGGVAHELNNPLSGILAFSQLMLRDLSAGTLDPAEQREFLREIETAAQRCKKIVEHLLRFSRQARMDKVDRVNLNLLIAQALPLIEHQYALRGVHITCQLDPDLPDVLGSEARLQQVLMNLLSNAFDATHQEKGTGPLQIQARTEACREGVVLAVRDQGAGIDEHHLPRLFSPFFTTKPQGRGTGLGLAVAYGIVTDHGGTIQAHNVPGGGAQFTVTLPPCQKEDAG